MVPDSQESPLHNRKAWVGRKTKVSLSAETHGASSNQRQSHEAGVQEGGKNYTFNNKSECNRTLLPFGFLLSVEPRKSLFWSGTNSESDIRWIPRSYLHVEVRSSTGVVLSRLTIWVISNPQRCPRVMWTLIQTEILSLRSRSEHYYLYCCGVQELSSTLIPIIRSAAEVEN